VLIVRLSGISILLAALCLYAAGSQGSAQSFTTLLSFDGTDGANSTAGLIEGRGTIFRVADGLAP